MTVNEAQTEEAVLECPICGYPRQHDGDKHRRQREFFYDGFYDENYVSEDEDESEDDEESGETYVNG